MPVSWSEVRGLQTSSHGLLQSLPGPPPLRISRALNGRFGSGVHGARRGVRSSEGVVRGLGVGRRRWTSSPIIGHRQTGLVCSGGQAFLRLKMDSRPIPKQKSRQRIICSFFRVVPSSALQEMPLMALCGASRATGAQPCSDRDGTRNGGNVILMYCIV